MTYTKIIEQMIDICLQTTPYDKFKRVVETIGLRFALEEYHTIVIRGGRQTGHTTTLIEWAKKHPSIIICKSESEKRYIRNNFGDIDGLFSSNEIDRLFFHGDVRYILLDNVKHWDNRIGKLATLYERVATNGRQDTLIIQM